jgi:hypothetical protein
VMDTQENMPQPEPETLCSAIASGQHQPVDYPGHAKQDQKRNGYHVDQPQFAHRFPV